LKDSTGNEISWDASDNSAGSPNSKLLQQPGDVIQISGRRRLHSGMARKLDGVSNVTTSVWVQVNVPIAAGNTGDPVAALQSSVNDLQAYLTATAVSFCMEGAQLPWVDTNCYKRRARATLPKT
jgi:hypothetical protein